MLQKKHTTIIGQAIIRINTGSIMVTNTDDSTTITFHLEENTLNELEKKSENDGISLDTLINEILMKHTELDTSESQSRIVSVDKPTVTKIFEKMSRVVK